jgi:hypothetical protein
VKDEPGVGALAKVDDEVPRRVEDALYLGDVVPADELIWRGPVELAEKLRALPVRIHRGLRVLDPSLQGDLREHVLARRGLEQTPLRGGWLGQGRSQLEDAGA